MRKKLVVCVLAALCLFVSASPWEGAAATAPEGELPGTGRYIATNSFPKNTIVDIVNIETNKSTRVIVANGLNSPGLLAIVSREAAELIGMRPGAVSRIRMTQPSDPVAYVRFTEGLTTGIPDYDSGSVITEEFVNPAAPPGRAASSDTGEYDALAYDSDPAAPVTAIPETGFPSYVLEPEWSGAASGARSARDIVDLPDTAEGKKPEEPKLSEGPKTSDEPESTAKTEPEVATEVSEKIAENLPEDEYEDYFEEPEEVAEYPEDEYYEDDFFEEPEEIVEYPEDEYYEDDFFEEPEKIPEKIVEYNIVPTDNRPPADIYGIDPAFIIPEVKREGKTETVNSPTRIVTDSRVEPDFSLPRKNELSRGSYYVQLVAHDTVESVENSISRIDQNYKQKFQPFVYKDSDQLYHVLLGPLNQGESYAVLQRFKSIGYKDAFVRVVR